MRINFIIATLLVIFIVAIAGCTSPTPSPATVSPTAVPTAIENASPTPIANASPSATAVASATPTAIASQLATTPTISASDISIDWDTTDIMQHDTVHLKVKNNYQYMLLDVDVVYTVTTQGLIVNPDNTSYVQNQTVPAVISQLGAINAGEVKDVTIQSDHRKNVPAFITIQANWRGGSAIVFQGMLNVPDHALGTKTF
jgi:hypothetical protein